MESDPYIRELEDRIRKQPNDHSLRLRIGLALFERKRYKEALPHIQRARQDSNLRSQALDIQSRILSLL
jgi:hypothetical protein